MTAPPVAVYDANVLFSSGLRDLLLEFADQDIVVAHWTDEIHDEWTRNLLAARPDLNARSVARTRRVMDDTFPLARVTGYEHLIPTLALPDPDDRHVLAAAVHAGATRIVTFNLRDFPPAVLAAHGVAAVHPDAFVAQLLAASPPGTSAPGS